MATAPDVLTLAEATRLNDEQLLRVLVDGGTVSRKHRCGNCGHTEEVTFQYMKDPKLALEIRKYLDGKQKVSESLGATAIRTELEKASQSHLEERLAWLRANAVGANAVAEEVGAHAGEQGS
jgi:hypothetical protein